MKMTEPLLIAAVLAARDGISVVDLARHFNCSVASVWRHLDAAVESGAQITRTHYSGPGVLWCAIDRRAVLVARLKAERREREVARQQAYNARMRVKVRKTPQERKPPKDRSPVPVSQQTVPAAEAPRVKTTAATSVFGWRP